MKLIAYFAELLVYNKGGYHPKDLKKTTYVIYSWNDIPNTRLKLNEDFLFYYRGELILSACVTGGKNRKVLVFKQSLPQILHNANSPIRTIIKKSLEDNPEINKRLTKQP